MSSFFFARSRFSQLRETVSVCNEIGLQALKTNLRPTAKDKMIVFARELATPSWLLWPTCRDPTGKGAQDFATRIASLNPIVSKLTTCNPKRMG